MLGKIFKSERTDNNNKQSTTHINSNPTKLETINSTPSYTPPNKKYQVQILQQVNQSPSGTPRENEVQTPGFTDNYGDLGFHMSKFEQKTNRMAEFFNNYNEQSEHQSEFSSQHLNVEQQHPMILSDSNANFMNTDRLAIMRIRNYVSDLKQVHMDLSEYVQDQKSIIEYFRQKICLEAEEFFRKYRNTGNQNQQSIKNINQLKITIQQQSQEIQRLQRELNQSKEQLDSYHQKNKLRNSNLYNIQQNGYSTISSQKQVTPCPNCKQLQQKISIQESQIEQRQAYIQTLVAENQSGQQRIFDLEQKIVGIDLQVQKRLKERSKNISERQLRARLQNMQSTSNDQERICQIEQLKEQIDALQQKCKKYERTDSKQNELLEKIRTVEEKELDLHYREIDLKESTAQLEEQKYIYSNKQRTIITAQDMLAKKNEELKNKQAELSQWQSELAKKERDLRYSKDNTFSHQFEEDNYDELNKSKQISLKSFGPNKDYHGFKIQGETFNNTNPVSLKQSLQITHNYNGKNQEIYSRYPTRAEGISRQKLRNEQRQPYSNLVNRDDRIREVQTIQRQRTAAVNPFKTAIVLNKKMDLIPSHYRELREESSFNNLREQNKLIKGGRIPPQFDLPSSHYRESSKNSRGTSKGVNQRRHNQLSRSGVSIRESTQLTGIGSKLQRLRAEIKKQIDSIK